MRASLLVLIIITACLLSAGEADPSIQCLVETARGLIRAQREDGSWLEPRARQLGMSWLPLTPAAGHRSSVAGLSFAAEALWRARTWEPAASAAAARAHLLAAKALIADPHRSATLEEAFPFLLAHAVRADQEGDPALAAAVQACRESFDNHLRRGSLGETFLGLIDPANPQRIDLLLTCLAVDLLPQQRRTWLADPGTRIARFQPLFPPVHTEGGAPPPATEFEDGTAFAIGCMQQPDDAAMELLRAAYGSKELKDMELTCALVCMRVFARRAQDPPKAWWCAVAERWTAELATQARRNEDEQGAWLEWLDSRVPIDGSSGNTVGMIQA